MENREALTIRFPRELLASARKNKNEGESLNELVVGALAHELRRRRGLKAHEEIVALREKSYRADGLQPDSGPLIRALRDGSGRGD